MSSTPPPQPPSDNPPPPSPRTPRPRKEPADRHVPGAQQPLLPPGRSDGVLRRTVVKPAGVVPDPVDAAYVANRLTALTHELANLLDGSLRVISLARRTTGEETPEHLSRHLDTVYAAMLQMADLVRNSMSGMAPSPPGAESLRRALGTAGSLAAAANHAVNVMRPCAEERGIELAAEIGPELVEVPAGPIYGVIINSVKNSIESIERTERGPRRGGRITVRAWMEAGRTGRCIGIEVTDDGQGPPLWNARSTDRSGIIGRRPGERSVFEPGVSAKDGGAGIGLALCKEVVEHLGGTIELLPRSGGPASNPGGAVLRVRYPAPAPMTDRHVG